jgi:hypothetical protein
MAVTSFNPQRHAIADWIDQPFSPVLSVFITARRLWAGSSLGYPGAWSR